MTVLRSLFGAAALLAAAPAPAQEVAPEQAAAEQTVLFGLDRTAFDAEGIDAIVRAARQAVGGGAGVVTVAGHTDTLGDAAYNSDLSRRRARAVAQDLLARGVPAAAVDAVALGQTSPAVPTGDGVAEPANRRVTITLSALGDRPLPDLDSPIRFPVP